jgi:hypothetical protein
MKWLAQIFQVFRRRREPTLRDRLLAIHIREATE